MRIRGGAVVFAVGLTAGLGLGWWVFPRLLYQRVEQPLQFSHLAHTEGAGMACADCHGFDEQGRFAGIPGVETCATCHESTLGDSPSEKRLVEEFVAPKREIPWFSYARQPDNAWFPHVQHVQRAQLACERCHGAHGGSATLRPFERNRINGYSRDVWGQHISGVSSEPWDGMKMADCSGCHRQRGVVESCQDCHK